MAKTTRTRKPRADKGKKRGSKKAASKATGTKRGPRGVIKLYYRLVNEGEVHTDIPANVPNLRPLVSTRIRAAVREVLTLSQLAENRDTHLGHRCQIIGLMDGFTITGKVRVQIKAER